ncbi:hypothetical protein M2275_006949 [Rhodococcus opacus]|nr:hypothetical protein [Rhodococcus opacus]
MPVKSEQRNQAWVAVRDHAQQQGRYRQWRDSLELVSAYFQSYLTDPDRAPSSPAVGPAWSAAETISRDAMAVTALAEQSPDAVLATQLDRLIAPWRAVHGSDSDRLAYATGVGESGDIVTDRPAPDDYDPDLDDYDLSLEDPVIDD